MNSRRSSPAMCIGVLAIWTLVAWRFDPRLWNLLVAVPGVAGKIAVFLFVGCMNVFWLLASYYLALAAFALISRNRQKPARPLTDAEPEVAILYTTMHDFQERAALSCVSQDYSNFHVYILDDSMDPEARALVDQFARRHVERVTVVRRSDRRGFKAGSLNNALGSIATTAPYFAIADADSVLPATFVRGLLPHLLSDEQIGWAQGSHRPHPQQHSAFATDLCLGIIPLWTLFCEPKNRFGFVMFLGHGGLVRRSVWSIVRGFPETVSEDLCFSTRAARRGYRGVFVPEVISFEDFPDGYRQLRRQQEKYFKGVCQFFHRECLGFVTSRNVLWYEKLDVLLSCLSLFVPVVSLLFLTDYCLLIPILIGKWQLLTVGIIGSTWTLDVLTPGPLMTGLWTRDYYCLTVVCTIAPALGAIGVACRYPRRGLRTLLLSPVPYISLMVVAATSVVSYLVTRQAAFLVTADRWGAKRERLPQGFSRQSSFAERIGAEDAMTQATELIAGLVLCCACVITANIALLAFAFALGLGPLLLRTRWDAPFMRPLLYAPFITVWVGIALANPIVLAGQGAWMTVFVFHF